MGGVNTGRIVRIAITASTRWWLIWTFKVGTILTGVPGAGVDLQTYGLTCVNTGWSSRRVVEAAGTKQYCCGTIEGGAILARIPGTIVYFFTQVLSCVYTGWAGRVTVAAGACWLRCRAIPCSAILTQVPRAAILADTLAMGGIDAVHIPRSIFITACTLRRLVRASEVRIIAVLTRIPITAQIVDTVAVGCVNTCRPGTRIVVTAGTGW